MKRSILFFLLLLLILESCDQQSKKKPSLKSSVKDEIAIIDNPSSANSQLPYLIQGDDGKLYFSWVDFKSDSVFFKFSVREGDNWSQPEEIAKGNNWFVNWADYPMIAVNKKGIISAHYLEKSSSGTYSYDVKVKVRDVEGRWSEVFQLHEDGTPTEHGFVTTLPWGDGFYHAWLDGRNTVEEEGAMTLRTAKWIDGKLSDQNLLDNRVCDCCQTGGGMTDNGPVLVYRNRSELEIRDIYLTRLINNSWTAPKPIANDSWEINGCPVNGPRLSAKGDNLAIAWYSAANNRPAVKLVFSSDGGETLTKPFEIDIQEPLGRVDVAVLSFNEAVVSWMANEGDDTYLKAALVNKIDGITHVKDIVKMSNDRGSGFPQLAVFDGDMFFTWMDTDSSNSISIKMSKMKIDSFQQ